MWLPSELVANYRATILKTDVSDHYPTLCNIVFPNAWTKKMPEQSPTRFKSFTELNHAIFANMISDTDLCGLIDDAQVEQVYDVFLGKLNEIYHMSYPEKTMRLKSTRVNPPWMSPLILGLIRNKRLAYRLTLRDPLNMSAKSNYLLIKREVKWRVRKAKEVYFSGLLDACQDNPKKSWAVVNEQLGRGSSILQLDSLITDSGTLTDQSLFANAMNKHFCAVEAEINLKFGELNTLPTFNSPRCQSEMLQLNLLSVDVELAINRSRANFTGCLTSIPGAVLKRHARILAVPLAKLFNRLLSNAIYPDALKTTTVTPLRKGGKGKWANKLSDLRPIGAIPFMAKLFDALVNKAIMEHIETNHLLSDAQFGFRRFCSTELAGQYLMDEITKNIDQHKKVLLTSLDVSRAFDSIDHRILIPRLEHYGVRGRILDFLVNYLSNRKLRTCYGKFLSDAMDIGLGVIQGSPISATLFTIFMDDLLKVNIRSKISAYADDCTTLSTANSCAELTSVASEDYLIIAAWFSDNRLLLNGKKSEGVVFGVDDTSIEALAEQLMINNEPLPLVKSTKILGFILDNRLSFNDHVGAIVGKMAAANAMILKLKLSGFPRASLLATFRALVMPHVSYGASIWQAASKALKKRVQVQQNKGLRIIFGIGPRESTESVRTMNRIMSVDMLISYSTAKLIYANSRGRRPHPLMAPSFAHHFGGSAISRSQSNGDLYVWAFNTEKRRRSIFVSGIRTFNNLPLSIRTAPSMWSFKNRWKSMSFGRHN
jgi:hypothetical protein